MTVKEWKLLIVTMKKISLTNIVTCLTASTTMTDMAKTIKSKIQFLIWMEITTIRMAMKMKDMRVTMVTPTMKLKFRMTTTTIMMQRKFQLKRMTKRATTKRFKATTNMTTTMRTQKTKDLTIVMMISMIDL